ncbi:MAG: CHAT domain-containing protein [Saprospiraceae bacterium]|jgi:CHAT domain-containing protein
MHLHYFFYKNYDMRILLVFCFLLVTSFLCNGQETGGAVVPADSSENLEEKTTEQLEEMKADLEKKGKPKELLVLLSLLEERIREENGIESKKYIDILSEFSFTYEGLGDYENAEIYYLKTLDAAKKVLGNESSTYILNLSYFGDFMKNKGDNEKAENYLLKAFELGKDKRADFDDIAEYAGLYGFLANYYRDIAVYSKALPLYLEELTIFERENSEAHYEYPAALSNLADLYEKIGQYEKGLVYSIKAVELTEKHHGKENFGYGQRINNLALSYVHSGEWIKADSLYKISIENAIFLFGKEHHEYAFRLSNSGINNQRLKNYSKAEQEIREALAILQNILPDHHRLIKQIKSKHASTLFYIGQRELAANQLIEALSLDIKGEEDFKLGSHLRMQWILDIEGFEEMADLFYLGCNREDLKSIKNSFEYLSENEQLNFSHSFQISNNLIESYAFRNKDKADLREACVDNQILWKGLLLENKRRLMKAMESNSDEDLRLKYLKWQELKKSLAEEYKLPASKRAKNFKDLVYKEEDLEGSLSRESMSFKKAQKIVNWKDLSNSLKADEAILEFSDFSFYNSASEYSSDSVFYVAYLIKNNLTTPIFIPLFEAKDLPKLNRTLSLYKFDKENKSNLYSIIWGKIEHEMKGIQTIYYSPSGLLNKINFSVIPINSTETIGDKFVLHNMGSTRQLVFPHETPIYQTTDAIVYGGIDYQLEETNNSKSIEQEIKSDIAYNRDLGDNYRGLRSRDWNYLEWTKKEAEDIASTLTKNKAKVTVLKGKEATEESFKSIGVNSSSPRILHLATHGYFFPDPKKGADTGFRASEHPLIRSGLILAGANHAWKGELTPEGKEDGILTAYEIAQMNLSNTELVVLSACDTGLGDIEGNEGVYGLQRAFKMAGVKYILMSLWSVDDKKTYEFMTRFYELSQTEGKPIPEAYQITQNEMRKKYALPFNPQAWAGFVLVE